MFRLIRFEIKKILKNKKGIVLFGFMILLIVIFVYSGIETAKSKQCGKMEDVKSKITEVEKLKKDSNLYNSNAAYYNEKESTLNDKYEALFNYKWKDELKYDIKLQQIEIDYLSGQDTDEATLKRNKDIIKSDSWYLDNDIQPQDPDTSIMGQFFIINFFKIMFPIIVVVILLLTVCDVLSQEIENGTYKILLLQPLSRAKIVIAKLITSVVYNLLFVAFSFIPCYIITCNINTFFTGWGSSIYPVTINNNCLPMLFSQTLPSPLKTTVSAELTLLIGAVMTAIIFVTCLAVSISALTRSSLQSILVSLGVYFVLFLANTMLPANLKVYNLFSYFNPVSLVQGVNGSILNLTLCYAVMPIICIVLISVGIFIYSKSDLKD